MTSRLAQVKFLIDQGVKDAKIIAGALGYDEESIAYVIEILEAIEKKDQNIIQTTNAITASGDINKEAPQMFKESHKAIAQRLVQLALDRRDEVAHISAKCAIYINEEVTGRNEARAKKQNNLLLLNIGDSLLQLKKANEAMERALPKGSNNLAAIDV